MTTTQSEVRAPAEVVAILTKYMPRTQSIFGYNLDTRQGRAHMKCRAAAKDFEGCLGIIPSHRSAAVIAKMNVVIEIQQKLELASANKGFYGSKDNKAYRSCLKTFEDEVRMLQEFTTSASTERSMLISSGQVPQSSVEPQCSTHNATVADNGFEVALRRVGNEVVQELKNQTPKNHFSGPVTILNFCNCNRNPALPTSSIEEEDNSPVSQEPQPSTSTSVPQEPAVSQGALNNLLSQVAQCVSRSCANAHAV